MRAAAKFSGWNEGSPDSSLVSTNPSKTAPSGAALIRRFAPPSPAEREKEKERPMPRVLISDKLSPAAVAIFKERGVEVDVKPGLDKEELAKIIGDYDGLAIRSATKVTAKLLEQAKNLKVVGRAGIGVDNVDIPAATARGVIVMNTPFGNSITTAEHAIALMFALARQIPSADASTQAGKWEKNRFMGVEITGKVLGIIGCGNIGSIVAERGIGLKMRVIAFDPFLSAERAEQIGVEKVELDDLLSRADVITLHTPMTAQTKNILSAENIAKTKKGVRIVNCARGGLVDEAALRAALDSGHVAGAAFDVFIEEPATANPLFGHPNVVATPHLGASTNEAQENVALQVAEQMSDYLMRGAISNAVNFPSITAEEAPRLKPFIALAEKLGSFAGQLTDAPISKITITYEGSVANLKIKALTSAAIAGLLRPSLADINVVSAPSVAAQRGIVIEEMTRAVQGDYESLITLSVTTANQERAVGGTVFHDGKPRILSIKGIKVDAEFTPSMIYVTNDDKPGFIGRFAGLLGEAGVNIATFALGRDQEGGSAIALVAIDGPAPEGVLANVGDIAGVRQAKALKF
jgi:D-3-phosphoglycerate dehydrogenase / 2-oxoglutarate reductase